MIPPFSAALTTGPRALSAWIPLRRIKNVVVEIRAN